jgi:hypothetical protein
MQVPCMTNVSPFALAERSTTGSDRDRFPTASLRRTAPLRHFHLNTGYFIHETL